MKKVYSFIFLSLAALPCINSVNATVHIVTCQNIPSHFLPVTTNAVVGDTIEWDWVAGNHVVGPMSASDIPNGAAMFNQAVDNNNLGFAYVVTVAGSYHYECHPSTPHGEPGYTNVTSGTGVPSIELYHVSNAYPNPFSDKVTIETTQADRISVYNMVGEKIYEQGISDKRTATSINLSKEQNGIYFYSILKEGVIVETRKLVKE